MLKFACIIPCYNRENFIAEAIRSALDQSPAPSEIIVADDASTDRSAEIAASFGSPVRVLRLNRGGAARARNAAVEAATADVVAFLDSDDLWLPGHLERLGRILEHEPEVAMAYETGVDQYESDAYDPEIITMNRYEKHDGWIYPRICEKNFINPGGAAVRREFYLQLGGFDSSLIIGEDWDLWCRIALRSPIRFTGAPGMVYRQHSGNISNNAERRTRDLIAFRKKRLAEIDEVRAKLNGANGETRGYSAADLDACKKFSEDDLIKRLKRISSAAHKSGDRRVARQHLKEALALRPISPRLIERYLKTFLP